MLAAIIGFATWPLIIRGVPGLSAAWLTIIIGIGMIIVAGVTIVAGMDSSATSPPLKSWLIGMLASLLNGVGMIGYGREVASSSAQLSVFIPIVAIGIPVITVAVATTVLGETLTTRKVLGVGVGLVAIWLLNS